FPGTERPSARDNEVNDDTSNTVTVLIDDLDDRRRNAGRHGSALWVEGLLDEPCRRARERGRAEDYRRARQAADRRSGGLGAGAECQRRETGRGRAERVQAGEEAQGPRGRPRDAGRVSRDDRRSPDAAAPETDGESDRYAANCVSILIAHSHRGVDRHGVPNE